MIKAILFDLDGTIANTIPALKHGINLTMRALGYPESTEADVLAHINHGARQLIRLSLPEELQADEGKVSEALALYNKMYEKTYMETDVTYDGIPEVFRELCARGYKLAVLSNKQDEFVVRLCEQLLPEGSYLVARGQREGVPTKPDPTAPFEIAAALGVEASECAFVGDTHVDVMTAKNAGMRAVAVSWGYKPRGVLEEAGADVIVDRAEELLDLFG